MTTTSRIFCRLLLLAFLLLGRRTPAGVLWLEIGAGDAAALDATGTPLTLQAITALGVTAYTTEGLQAGSVDLAGLDTAGTGHLVGVVRVPAAAGSIVHLRTGPDSRELSGDLGGGTVLDDDFSPVVNPAAYRVHSPLPAWTPYWEMITIAVDGFGTVEPASGRSALGTVTSLTATPAAHWDFARWEGDVPAGQTRTNPLSLLVTANLRVTAVFEPTITQAWCQQHFTADTVDAEDDPDKDGYTNRQEFANGTDPKASDEVDFQLSLKRGWNMISLPLQPADGTSPANLLPAEIAAKVSNVWWEWNPFQKCYTRLENFGRRKGYWVYAFDDVPVVTVHGQVIVDRGLQLASGWTLFGVGQTDPESFDPTPGATIPVWGWEPVCGGFTALPCPVVLQPGSGYWFYVTIDTYVEDFR